MPGPFGTDLARKGQAQVPAAQARDKSGSQLPRTQKAIERRPGPRFRSSRAVANSIPRALQDFLAAISQQCRASFSLGR